MIRQRQAGRTLLQAARLGLGRGAAALPCGDCRSMASQAAPAESSREGPALPPFSYTPPRYTGPPKEEVLALRKAHLSPGELPGGREGGRSSGGC